MKRQQFLKQLALLPPLALLATACKKHLIPDTPTIVTGKVTDEDGLPVEGAEFLFIGVDVQDFFKEVHTFEERQTTNKYGIFEFSVKVPYSTEGFYFAIQNAKIPIRINNVFIQEGSNWIDYWANIRKFIESIKREKINIINFQLRKK